MNRKILFIVNPASGGGLSKGRWQDILPKLERADLSFDYQYTTGRGDAITSAYEAVDYDVVVAFGGDGTANEVINGLFRIEEANRPLFTIFPSGTGSDSVRTLGIDDTLEVFIELLKTAQPRGIDIGTASYRKTNDSIVSTRYFLNACDVGIGAQVAHAVNTMNQHSTQQKGKGKYLRAILNQVVKFQPFLATAVTDAQDEIETKTVIMAICNGRYFGGGIEISPLSSMSDGTLEIITTKELSKMGLLRIIPKLYKGTHLKHRSIVFKRAEQFEITLKTPQLLETDGEVMGEIESVTFEVKKQALSVLY